MVDERSYASSQHSFLTIYQRETSIEQSIEFDANCVHNCPKLRTIDTGVL